ncbi:MAG: HNH endonuclease, partial [Gammaproteobacteria bacterium]|nr:HNH endonuclease [Gammaproteobacteria bacterium]
TEQRYVDAHHIIHWADGGETSLENCTMLCRHHHRLVHEEGFGCERGGDGEMVFTDPAGSVLTASFRLDPTTYTSIVDLHRRQKLGISAETALASTEWGHGMDMRMLMDCMINASHGPNFSYPFPKPLPPEEREEKIARKRRLDAITRERFPLTGPDHTSPRKPGGDSRGSNAV